VPKATKLIHVTADKSAVPFSGGEGRDSIVVELTAGQRYKLQLA
jgi:hypothetical protein